MRILLIAHEMEQDIHSLRFNLHRLAHRVSIISHDEERLIWTN